MSRTELYEKGGEGPPDEGCSEREEKEEVKEGDKGDVEGREAQGMQGSEIVQETRMMGGKNGIQEASKNISQVSFILF